jgi:hypothetical protein
MIMEIRGEEENVTKHGLTMNILWIRNEKNRLLYADDDTLFTDKE